MFGVDAAGKAQVGGNGFFITTTGTDAQKAAAWDLVKWWNQEPQQVQWHVEGSYLPFLASAASSPEVQAFWTSSLAGSFLKDPVKVEVTPPGKAADKVEQYVHFLAGKNDKTELLKKTLTENPQAQAMVFMRTKHTAEKLSKHLAEKEYAVASIHGNKSQGQRERALKAFRDGEIRVLVATDVAARGIDIPGVSHVFNYDLPEVPDAYVHRIGRTARAGRDGIAIAFCTPDEAHLLRDIERLMGIEITTAGGEPDAGLDIDL